MLEGGGRWAGQAGLGWPDPAELSWVGKTRVAEASLGGWVLPHTYPSWVPHQNRNLVWNLALG